jgi:hypothetical protein
MNDDIEIQVKVKPLGESISLTLHLKIFKKKGELKYFWQTSENSLYCLQIMQQDKNYIFTGDMIVDPQIQSTKEEIAEKMMEKIPVFY